jgi:hypothetical protein
MYVSAYYYNTTIQVSSYFYICAVSLLRAHASALAADSTGFLPLHYAARSGSAEAANVLLAYADAAQLRTRTLNRQYAHELAANSPDCGAQLAADLRRCMHDLKIKKIKNKKNAVYMRPRTTTYMCVNSSTEVCWFYLSSGRAPPIYAPSHYYIAYICVLILLPNAAENTCSRCTGSASLVASYIFVLSKSVFFTHPTAERRRKHVLDVHWFYLSCGL